MNKMAYFYATGAMHVTIFLLLAVKIDGGKIQLVLNFTWLHSLNLTTHSYALLKVTVMK